MSYVVGHFIEQAASEGPVAARSCDVLGFVDQAPLPQHVVVPEATSKSEMSRRVLYLSVPWKPWIMDLRCRSAVKILTSVLLTFHQVLQVQTSPATRGNSTVALGLT